MKRNAQRSRVLPHASGARGHSRIGGATYEAQPYPVRRQITQPETRGYYEERKRHHREYGQRYQSVQLGDRFAHVRRPRLSAGSRFGPPIGAVVRPASRYRPVDEVTLTGSRQHGVPPTPQSSDL